MDYTHHYHSPLGGMTMASDGKALTGLWFDGQKYFADTLSGTYSERDLSVFDETDHWLDIYFSGRQPDFIPTYRMDGLTPFRKMVSDIMCEIPFGQTVTYGGIAKRIEETHQGVSLRQKKMSAQAVGGAVGWNPICIIVPCHRVVGANGNLTGYGGGMHNKIALLKHEGLDMRQFFCVK